MLTKTHVFTHPRTGLLATAKHYKREERQDWDGLSLIFAHGISFHKEQWEPTIQRLFDHDAASPRRRIRDAWSLDWQSHGEAGVLNKSALLRRDSVSTEEYADLLAYFVSSSFVSGRRLVAVGHSASTTAWVLAAKRSRRLPFVSMIFFEPVTIVPPVLPNDPRFAIGKANTRGAMARPFSWPSLNAAAAYLSARYPWKAWDSRVLRLYLTHALSVDPATGIVSTTCLKEQEVGVYEAGSAHIMAGAELSRLCASIPVHMIFGERPEMVSRKAREQLCDASAGRRMASIQLVPNAGHLAIQENPDGSALALFNTVQAAMTQASMARL